MLTQVGPQLWDCPRSHCNSQFYIDHEGLLAVRDRVPKVGRRSHPQRELERQASQRLAAGCLVGGFAALGWALNTNTPFLGIAAMVLFVISAIVAIRA